MGHFDDMENICTMDEQRKCELKMISGKIGWILLIAYLGSLILSRIMPIVAGNMAFYIFWAGIVWMGMKKWGRLSLLDTCYSKNKYELSVLEKGLLTAFVIFLSHVFCAFFLFLYAKVFQDIVMMNDKSLHSGLDIFTGVILGPLVEEWIFRGMLWSKLKSYGICNFSNNYTVCYNAWSGGIINISFGWLFFRCFGLPHRKFMVCYYFSCYS